MNSSYNNKVSFGAILESITIALNPKKIVECGILEGFSLKRFAESSNKDTIIQAYDIFDEFDGCHAKKDKLTALFTDYDNVSINYGDFYEVHKNISDVNIIHIDIANDGDIYEYAIKHYLPKLSDKGVLLMEGGSEERDNVEWMIKYNKSPIQPIVKKYGLKVIGEFPSITIIKKS